MLRQAGKIRSEDAETIGQRAPFCPSHIPRTIVIARTTVDVKTMIVQHFHKVQLIFSEKNLVTPVSNYVERIPLRLGFRPLHIVKGITLCVQFLSSCSFVAVPPVLCHHSVTHLTHITLLKCLKQTCNCHFSRLKKSNIS